MEEKNDWLASLIYNPDKDYDNFRSAGYDGSNTVLKSKEDYQKVPEIQKMFTTDGNFDKNTFDKFYDSALSSYNDFVNNDTSDKYLRDVSVSRLNTSKYAKGKTQEVPKFTISHISNPQQITTGVAGVYEQGTPKLSMREAAQKEKIFNFKTGKEEDSIPNDFFNSLFGESLVEAKWGEDGVHKDDMGREVKHFKGQWKLNSNGNPYYETLGDRDAVGKDFLHMEDVLTDDGSFLNSIDFFDSDSLQKSATGATFKAVAALVPLFIPYVNIVYGAAGATLALSDIFGTIGKAITELQYKDDVPKPEIWKDFNTVSSWTKRFGNSYSDEDSESNWNYNKLVGMVSDITSQLMQQRALAKIPSLLAGSEKRAVSKYLLKYGEENSTKLGKTLNQAIKDGDIKKSLELLSPADYGKLRASMETQYKIGSELSSTYMALVQAKDVYETMKQNNFSEEARAAGLIASTLGFYGLMKTELGQWVLKGVGIDESANAIRQGVKQYAKEVALDTAEKVAKDSTGKFAKILDGINNFYDKGKNLLSKSSTTMFSNMAKEGLEEISEEFLSDTVIGGLDAVESAFAQFGDKGKRNTYNWSNTNPLERYLLSGVGGALGGAIFAGVDKTQNWLSGNLDKAKNAIPKDAFETLKETMLRYGEDYTISEIEKLKDKGSFLPTTLTGDLDESSTADKKVFKPTTDKSLSQNDIAFDHLIGILKGVSSIINSEGLQLSQDEVVNMAFLKQTRLTELSKNGIDKTIYKEYLNLSKKLVDVAIEKQSLEQSDKKDGLDKVNQEYNDLKKELSEILEGNRAGEYTQRMAFSLTPTIKDTFVQSNIDSFSRFYLNKKYINLSDEEKKIVDDNYSKYSQDKEKWERISFKMFKNVKNLIQNPLMSFVADNGLLTYTQQFYKELNQLSEDQNINYKEKLTDEEKTEYETLARNNRTDDEIIASENLNPKENSLNEDQKKELVQTYIDTVVQKEAEQTYVNKLIQVKDKQMRLGINPILNERGDEQLIGLVQLLSKYPTIDEQGFKMLQKIKTSAGRIDVQSLINGYLRNINLEQAKRILSTDNQWAYIDALLPIIREKIDLASINAVDNVLSDGLTIEDASAYFDDIRDYLDGGLWSGNVSFNTETNELKIALDKNEDLESIPDGATITVTLTEEDIKKLVKEAILHDMNSVEGDNTDIRNLKEKETFKILFESNPQVQQRIQLLDQADKATEQVFNSPINQILSIISQDILGEDIFELINLEEGAYSKLNNLSSYVISNSLRKEKLKQALDIIEMLRSTFRSSISNKNSLFDFNTIINDSLRKVNLPELQSLSYDQNMVLERTLDDLSGQINFLIRLDEINSGSKSSESKKTDIRITSLLSSMFSNYANFRIYLPPAEFIDEDGNKISIFDDINLTNEESDLLSKIIDKNSDSIEDAQLTTSILNRIENEVYAKFHSLTEEQQNQVLNNIVVEGAFIDESSIKRDSTFYDLDTKFRFQWLVDTLAVQPDTFNNKYSSVLSKDTIPYAPFYTQRIAIRSMYSHAKNPEFYNKILEIFSKKKSVAMNIIPNFLFTNGDPGSGKTTAVAFMFKELMDDDYNLIAAAVKTERARNLGTQLEKQSYDRDALFNLILSDSGKEKFSQIINLIKERDAKKLNDAKITSNNLSILDSNKLNLRSTLFTKEDFADNLPDAIVFDEITHLSSIERDIISKSGILLLGLGDVKQEGYLISGQPMSADNNGYYYSTPSLSLSIRANNLNKKDNLDVLSAISKSMDLQYDKKNQGIPTNFKVFEEELSKLSLRYFERQGTLQGDKIMDKNDISESYLRSIIKTLKDGETIGYIYDSEENELHFLFDKLAQEFPDKVITVNADHVQGSEYKYTVVDLKWPNIDNANYDETFYNNFRKLYTLITRSSEGTILVSNQNLLMNNSTKLSYQAADSSLSKDDIDDYKIFAQRMFNGEPIEVKKEQKIEESEKPDFTIEKRDALEANKKEESEDFLDSNLQVITSHNSIGYGYKNGNNFEDLSFLTNIPDKDDIKSLFFLKSLFKRSIDENTIDELFSLNRGQLIDLDIFKGFFGLNNIDEFKEALKKGSYKIKYRNFNSQYDNSINSTYSSNFKGFKDGEKFAKVVYQINVDGKILDITIGNINLTNEKLKPELKEIIESNEFGYLNINSNSFKFSNIRYRQQITGEKRDTDNFNEKTTLLGDYSEQHPELAFDDSIYIRPEKKTSGYQNASAVVFTTHDLWQKKSLLSNYVEALESDESLSIAPTYLGIVGRNYETFASEWLNILGQQNMNMKDLNQLYGYQHATKMFKAIYDTRKKLVEDNSTDTNLLEGLQNILNALTRGFNEDNSVIDETSNIKTGLEAIMIRYRNGDYSGRNLGYKLPKFNNYLRLIARELEKTETEVLIPSLRKAITEESLNTTDWSDTEKKDFVNTSNEIIKVTEAYFSNKKIFNAKNLFNLFDKNILFGVYNSLRVMDNLVKATHVEGDEKTKKRNLDAMNFVINTSPEFKHGIWYNNVDLERKSDDEAYYPAYLNQRQVFIDGPIQSPHMYIDYSNITIDEKSNITEDQQPNVEELFDARPEYEKRAELVLNAIPESVSLQGNQLEDNQLIKIKNLISETFELNPDKSIKDVLNIVNKKLSNGSITPLINFSNNSLVANDFIVITAKDDKIEFAVQSNNALSKELLNFLSIDDRKNKVRYSDYKSGVMYFIDNSGNEVQLKAFTVVKNGNNFKFVELSKKDTQFRELIIKELEEMQKGIEEPVVNKTDIKLSLDDFRKSFSEVFEKLNKNTVLAKFLNQALDIEQGKYYNQIIKIMYNVFGTTKFEITSSDLGSINTEVETNSTLSKLADDILEILNNVTISSDGTVTKSLIQKRLITPLITINYNKLKCK